MMIYLSAKEIFHSARERSKKEIKQLIEARKLRNADMTEHI